MDQRVIDLYDEYTHVHLDRRLFLDRLARLTGGAAAAMALLPLLEARNAVAQVAEGDPGLHTETTGFAAPTGQITGYLARPRPSGPPLPGVVVIHENRGLTPYIRDVARRLATSGYVAFAPDLLSPMGGTPADPDIARDMIGKLDRSETVANARAAVEWLRGRDDTTRRAGMVGFCWGGGLIGQVAAAAPDLNAAVVFYGAPPEPAKAAAIKAPLLLHYAGLDERINTQVPAFREALDKTGVTYELHMYEGANHAFHNDGSPARYHPEAARLAWQRTLAFFERTLRQG